MDDDEEDDGLGEDDDEVDVEAGSVADTDFLAESDAEDDDWEGIESGEDESGSDGDLDDGEVEEGGQLAWDELFEQAVGASEKPEPKLKAKAVVDRSSDYEDDDESDDLEVVVDGEAPKISAKAAGKKRSGQFLALAPRTELALTFCGISSAPNRRRLVRRGRGGEGRGGQEIGRAHV